MNPISNTSSRSLRQYVPGGLPRAGSAAALLVFGALGCSDATTAIPTNVAGSGGSSAGQAAGGAGSAGMPAASGSSTGGTPSTTGGTGGAAAAGTGGGGMGPVAGSGGTAGAGGVGGAGGTGGAPDDGWVPLFNGTSLDGWTPYGNSNPTALFTVANGEIHVYPTQSDGTSQPEGNLVHDMELGGKYTLHVEYKWGEARFVPRANTDRDAGILFHISGDVERVWPHSIECQLGSSPVSGEWTSGDLWVIGGPTTAEVKNASDQLQAVMKNGDYGFFGATEQAELAHGQWNTVQVIVNGAEEATYLVNGKVVNRVYNMKYNGQPLSKGHVSVQAEYAEVFYRNIRYKVDQ